MISRRVRPAVAIAELYHSISGDPDFVTVAAGWTVRSDSELADLIEADARFRMLHSRPLSLERYLTAIPDLPDRADALDAAIDMAVRALANTSHADESVVEELVSRYPDLESAIREAAALSDAVWSTTNIRAHFAEVEPHELPFDFGPMTPGGVRRYELRELLGEGAFGKVYLAVDRQLSEPDHEAMVSIKILTGQGRVPWERDHRADEATKARRINHPNVVRVLDRGVSEDDEDFIVYDFIDGGDLAKWARQRRPAVAVGDAVRMVARMARGVHAAHMAGLVHCDLKPANIVITAEGEPKVADFGIAVRPMEQDAASDDGAGRSEPLGNLAFMSPEQYRVEPGALTIPTDVYALGGILYWLLTSQLPNGTTPEEIRNTHDPSHGRRSSPSLRPLRDGVDATLEMICQRAMSLRPDDRYSSAAAFADDLEAWLRHESIRWTRPSAWRRLRLWVRRKPATAVLLFVTALILTTSAFVIWKLSVDAAVTRERVDSEKRKRVEFKAYLEKFRQDLKSATKERVSANFLTNIWLMEWIHGPTVLGDVEATDRYELWRIRTEVVRRLIRDAQARGEADSLQTLMWESALAFWMIKDGNYTEAGPLLNSNAERWRSLLSRDDPWLRDLRALQMCVVVDRLADSTPESGKNWHTDAELANAASILNEAELSAANSDSTSAFRRTLLDKLHILYGPKLLDDPTRLAEIAVKIKEASKDPMVREASK